MREKLEQMSELVRENQITTKENHQKAGYDKNARDWQFKPEDQVLVRLSTHPTIREADRAS